MPRRPAFAPFPDDRWNSWQLRDALAATSGVAGQIRSGRFTSETIMSTSAAILPTRSGAASRLAVLSYGALAYVGFLAAFLYAIGFVHDVLVPTSLAAGSAPSDKLIAILVNVSLLLLFGVQHNIMARPGFKKRWTQIIPPAAERSTFVLATVLLLFAIFTFWRPLPDVVWQLESPIAGWSLHALAAAGWLTVLVSTFLIDHFGLFGLRQVWAHARGVAPNAPAFTLRGTYRWVRHPLMLGFLAAFWAAPTMTEGRLLFAGVITAWVLFTLRFLEERDLIAEYGESYLAYKRSVPGILPWPRPRA